MEEYGYLGLLASSFLAATILPLSSEVVLVALATTGEYPAQAVMANCDTRQHGRLFG